MTRDARIYFWTLIGVIALAVGVTSARASSRVLELRQHERQLVRQVETAKTTIRWFERHGQILYSPSPYTRRVAWHAIALARQRVIVGRRDLAWTRKEIRRLSVPAIPHRAQWMCIHRYEGAWNDPGAPYWGGLQMDLEFQQTYAPWLLRSKGTADHWTPDEQMQTAERAYRSGRGFGPWPNTRRMCGL